MYLNSSRFIDDKRKGGSLNMIRGIISGVTAMRSQVLIQEVIANNLANASTCAYDRDTVVLRSFNDVLISRLQPSSVAVPIGYLSAGTVASDVRTIRSAGPLEVTDNPLDIALPEGAYLCVETDGGIRYTRRGDLEISADGFLRVAGYRVLGNLGPVRVDPGKTCSISPDGTVLVDSAPVDNLKLVAFQDESSLVKEGNSLYRSPGNPVQFTGGKITPGALEKSSVEPVSEMVSMIQSMRLYEASERAIRSHDEMLENAVNRVGRVQ